jgi:hypothetical protein
VTAEQLRNALSHLDAILNAASYVVPIMVLGMVALGMVLVVIHDTLTRFVLKSNRDFSTVPFEANDDGKNTRL